MIALGFSAAGARPPPPCIAVAESGCTLVLLPKALAGHGRARLAAQTACLNALGTLVPFAAGASPPVETARQWLADNRAFALAALEDLRGHGQLSLMAEFPQARHRAQNGADWLRIRARQMQAQRARCAALQDHLTALTQEMGGRHVVRTGDRGLRFDLLVPQGRASEIRQAWATALSRPAPQTAGWRATLTGAWPAAAFWNGGTIA